MVQGVGREGHTALWKRPCPSGLFNQQFYQVSLDVGVRQSIEKVPVQSLKRLLGEGRQILISNDNVSLEQLIVPNAVPSHWIFAFTPSVGGGQGR